MIRSAARTVASRAGIAVILASVAVTPLVAQGANKKPPVEPARVTGELLAGAYGGMGGYLIGSYAGTMLGRALPTASEGTKKDIAFVTGVLGAGVATAASVSAVGHIGDQTGSYQKALVGAAGGMAAAVLLNQVIYGHARLPSERGSSRVRWLEASLEALLPSIGATIAFNSTRAFK
ncbi:MAG: hypothetical protein FJ202_11035 [Gemmatimonadetes bacterium]|nr:hypothetical protein [Gemmatimonadota bacterium]